MFVRLTKTDLRALALVRLDHSRPNGVLFTDALRGNFLGHSYSLQFEPRSLHKSALLLEPGG